MADLELTALDGGRVSVSGPEVPSTTAGSTTFAVLAVGSRLHEFTSGDARFARAQAESLSVVEKATYRMHGGLVRISTGEEAYPEGGVVSYMHVAWESQNHTLATVMYQGDAVAALALLDALAILEESNGIVLAPRDTRISILQENQHAPGVYVPIRGEGLVHVARASRYWDKQRPAWAGKQGRGGQLYAEQHESGEATLALFAPRAFARVHLNDKHNRLANGAIDLAVDWVSR